MKLKQVAKNVAKNVVKNVVEAEVTMTDITDITEKNDYLAHGKALIAGLYQKAIKERNQGKPYRMAYLRHLEAIDPGEPTSLAFFLHGDSIGYTPGIEVEDAEAGRKIGGRRVSMAAGAVFGALAGSMAGGIVYEAISHDVVQEQPVEQPVEGKPIAITEADRYNR